MLLFLIPVILGLLYFLIWGDNFINIAGRQLADETKAYACRFLRFMAVPALLPCLVLFTSALLNLNKRFKVPALMAPLNAAVTLLSLVLLHDRIGIWALPIGFAVSYLVQTPVILIRALRTGAVRFVRPALTKRDISLIWSLSGMLLITQGILMINTFVDKWFATGLEVGSISSINYSLTLVNFGVQLFSLSLIVVMFTKMSEYMAADEYRECDQYIRSNLVRVANLVVPVCLALFVISPEVVRILFQRGAFDATDTVRTSGALGMYMLGLPALVINGIITKIFQSMQRLKAKVMLAFQYLVTNIIGNILLVGSLKVVGLAISSSIAINLHLLLSIIVLRFFQDRLRMGRFASIIGRAYVMAAVSWLIYWASGAEEWLEGVVTGRGVGDALILALAKFAIIVALYGIQVLVWFGFFHRNRPGSKG
jgi:putative peptidoglycan lipid II flippase